jgi:hypothetical protein
VAPGGGPVPPQAPQRQWAGAVAVGAFPPAQPPTLTPAAHPLGAQPAQMRAQEEIVASRDAFCSSRDPSQLQSRPQRVSVEGGSWSEPPPPSRDEVPFHALSGGGFAGMERARPDERWLQELPSLKHLIPKTPGVIKAGGAPRQPQVAPPPGEGASADWTSRQPGSSAGNDSFTLPSHGESAYSTPHSMMLSCVFHMPD